MCLLSFYELKLNLQTLNNIKNNFPPKFFLSPQFLYRLY